MAQEEEILNTSQQRLCPKLLQVTTVPATLKGFLLPFASHFRERGWEVDAMARNAPQCAECIEAFDHVWDVRWSRNPLDPSNLLAASRQVRKVVVSGQYDIVHVHTPVAAFVTRYALRNIRKQGKPRVIYTAHGFHFYQGGPLLKSMIFQGLEKSAGDWTDYLIVINREDEAAAKRLHLVPPQRVRYMPGIGLDTTYYAPAAVFDEDVAAVRRELGLSARDSLLLMIAGFDPGKRHRDVLQALARLGREDAHLAFAGEGCLFAEMKRLAGELKIQQQVHFLGRRSDIPALVRASVATCLPSEREGLARSVMESLSLEVPVIGANARGIRDLLDGDCGVLVEVGDVEGLRQAMAWVLEHPGEARAMGKRGRERMAEYDIRHILNMHEQLYAEALSL